MADHGLRHGLVYAGRDHAGSRPEQKALRRLERRVRLRHHAQCNNRAFESDGGRFDHGDSQRRSVRHTIVPVHSRRRMSYDQLVWAQKFLWYPQKAHGRRGES